MGCQQIHSCGRGGAQRAREGRCWQAAKQWRKAGAGANVGQTNKVRPSHVVCGWESQASLCFGHGVPAKAHFVVAEELNTQHMLGAAECQSGGGALGP